MRLEKLLPTSARIVEIGASHGDVAEALIKAGYSKYLLAAHNQRQAERLTQRRPDLRPHTAVAPSKQLVRQNNGDLLILHGRWSFASHRSVRHARFVAVKLTIDPLSWLAVLLFGLRCLWMRYSWPRRIDCRGRGRGPYLAVFRTRRPRPHGGVRRFIPHAIGVRGFFERLSAGNCRYAVLRWFDDLPKISAGEDLDLLVDDAELEVVRELLDSGPGIQAVDVYSVSGLPGADFRGMPYFPPYLADELLERVKIHRGLFRVPAAREHFLSLAYHALYHKGAASGLPSNTQGKKLKARADHDYSRILSQLAQQLGLVAPVTLTDLDKYLDSQGWRPPHDMLIRLSRRNKWVRTLLDGSGHARNDLDPLAVFLVRKEALRRGGVERAKQLLVQHGFSIVTTRTFDETSAAMIARSIRGGNWGRGPWPVSGGPPAAAIVVHDPSPLAVSRKYRKKFPFVANARLFCKERIREAFNEGLPEEQHCNVIHSSDNGRETMDYLRIIMPDKIRAISELVHAAAARRAA
jgi:hypothetical protein